MNKKVLLGMSGGVDSSVAAILLKEQGYNVIGATMKLCEKKEDLATKCCSFCIEDDAKKVCDKLGIQHYVFNFEKEFKQYVIDDFIEEYKNCRTPNPCIQCNKHLKFDILYKKAQELGCQYIATGHYAKSEYMEKYKQVVLKKSNSQSKDQTYFLYGIPKEVIPKIIFPLENYTDKTQIRKIAKDYNLEIAKKPDSQEICFIPDNDYAQFLLENINKLPNKGNIVDVNGNVLGKHKGLIYYTIGQRKGLGISNEKPLYVIKLDNENNRLIVGTQEDLYSKELIATDLNMLVFDKIDKPLKVKAKIRYRAQEADATICEIKEGYLKVIFEQPQRAITKGQSVVFYIDDIVIGGGKII